MSFTQSQLSTPDTQASGAAENGVSESHLPSSEQLQNNVTKLGAQLPSTSTPQLRGALIASKGDMKLAAEHLRSNTKPDLDAAFPAQNSSKSSGKGRDKQSNSCGIDSGDTQPFDLHSITPPETHDASTPKIAIAAESRAITPKASQRTATKKKLKLKSKPPILVKKQLVIDLKDKGKTKVTDDDFDIQLGSDEEQDLYTALSGRASNRAPGGSSSKVAKKNTKEPKAALKTRKSAPALLERPTIITISKRAATVTASQNLHNPSDNKIEEPLQAIAKVTKPKPSRDDMDLSQKSRLPPSKESAKAPPLAEPADGDLLFSQSQEEIHALRLLTDDVPSVDPNGLYSASPRLKVTSKPTQVYEDKTVPKHKKLKSSPLTEFADLLDEMMNDIVSQNTEKEVVDRVPHSAVQETLIQKAKKSPSGESRAQSDDLKSSSVAAVPKQYSMRSKTLRSSQIAMPPPPSVVKTNPKNKRAAPQQFTVTEIEVGKGTNLASSSKTPAIEADSKRIVIVIADDEEDEDESFQSSPEDQMAGDSSSIEEPALETPKQQILDRSKKRKATQETPTPSKRRRSLDDTTAESMQSLLRRSPRVQKMAKAKEVTNKLMKAKFPSPPTRISPRLAARKTEAPSQATLSSASRKKFDSAKERALTLVNKTTVLVDEHLARKRTVIGFSSKRPRNQGPSSGIKGNRSVERKSLDHDAVSVIKNAERKRKYGFAVMNENDSPLETQSPPKKRQSISPPDEGAFGQGGDQCNPRNDSLKQAVITEPIENGLSTATEVIIAPTRDSASPIPMQCPDAISAGKTPIADGIGTRATVQVVNDTEEAPDKGAGQRTLRHNSQNARVDENGSPIPSSIGQIDHIGKAKQKLREALSAHLPVAFHARDGESASHSGVFGTKIVLGSIPKARPSSPEAVVTRYIPHTRTKGGLYEGVGTNQVVEPEKQLLDPFVDPMSRTRSGFTDRLLASGSILSKAPRASAGKVNMEAPKVPTGELPTLPSHATKSSSRGVLEGNGNGKVPKKKSRLSFEDVEKTLVNPENRPSFNETLSELTSGTSVDSNDGVDSGEMRSSPPAQSGNTKWNVALRPHYKHLSDAVHRIANVSSRFKH